MQLLQVADGRVDATVLLGDLDETPELLLDIGVDGPTGLHR